MAKARHQIQDTSPMPYDTSHTPVRTTSGRWRLQKQGDRLLYVNDAGDVMEVPPPGPPSWIVRGPNLRIFSPDSDLENEE